jgi:hypothetical protein
MNTDKFTASAQKLRIRIRWLTASFIIGLVISGGTAIPIESEVDSLASLLGRSNSSPEQPSSSLTQWLSRVQTALHETNTRYPFIAYGGDWLAFGHFAIALAFVGAWRDPVRNRWLFDFGLITCALVVPYAFFFGALRGIPFWWRLVDASFGVLGSVPLWLCRRWTLELSRPEGCASSPHLAH